MCVPDYDDDDASLVHDPEERMECIPLEKRCIAHLKTIVDSTGCKIVLSTTWRKFESQRAFLISTLNDAGIDVVGSTPGGNGRGFEIVEWLIQHPEVSNCVVIDDDVKRHGGSFQQALVHPHAKSIMDGYFVQTMMWTPSERPDDWAPNILGPSPDTNPYTLCDIPLH